MTRDDLIAALRQVLPAEFQGYQGGGANASRDAAEAASSAAMCCEMGVLEYGRYARAKAAPKFRTAAIAEWVLGQGRGAREKAVLCFLVALELVPRCSEAWQSVGVIFTDL